PILAVVALVFAFDEASVIAVLALLAGEFLYMHVDYPPVTRVGLIPASAVLMALRMATVAVALAMAIAVAAVVRQAVARLANTSAALIAAIVLVVVLQLAYF